MTTYKTVLLNTSHEAYNPEQQQYVASGYLVDPDVSFPLPSFIVAEGTPEELEAIPYVVKSLIDILDEFFKSQPLELQLAFAGPKALAREYAEIGDEDKIREIVETVEVPAELEPLKAQLLALFPEA